MLTALTRAALGRGRVHALRTAGLAASVWLTSASAFATGPVELFSQVAVDPARPDRRVLLYSNTGTRRGLVFSDDGGAHWQLLCADAIFDQVKARGNTGAPEDQNTLQGEVRRIEPIVITAGGPLFAGSAQGLFADQEAGCGFHEEGPFVGLRVSGLRVHPTQPERAFVMIGFEGPQQGMWRRESDGTWNRFGVADPAPASPDRFVLKSMLVAPHAGDVRVYQTLWRYAAASKQVSVGLRVSDDGANTWREYPLESANGEISLLAFDPSQPERIVGVVRRSDSGHGFWPNERDTLLVSDDGGAHFRTYFEVAELGAVAFEPDGTLWIADAGANVDDKLRAGLFRAAAGLAQPPEQLSDDAFGCLWFRADTSELHACQRLRFGKVNLDEGGVSLDVSVEITTVREFVQCEGSDMPALCREQMCQSGYCVQGHFPWAPVCEAYDEPYCGPRAIPAGLFDAGAAEAGSPSPAESRPTARDSDPADTYDAGVIVIPDPPAMKKRRAGCALHAAPSDLSAFDWTVGSGLALLWLRRAPRFRVKTKTRG